MSLQGGFISHCSQMIRSKFIVQLLLCCCNLSFRKHTTQIWISLWNLNHELVQVLFGGTLTGVSAENRQCVAYIPLFKPFESVLLGMQRFSAGILHAVGCPVKPPKWEGHSHSTDQNLWATTVGFHLSTTSQSSQHNTLFQLCVVTKACLLWQKAFVYRPSLIHPGCQHGFCIQVKIGAIETCTSLMTHG